MVGACVFGLICFISGGIHFIKGAPTPSGCKPVNLLMVLSGDAVLNDTYYPAIRDHVLGVAGNLAPGSNLTLMALGQTAKRITHGTTPELEENLEADLEEHRGTGFLSGDTLSGQLLLYTMVTTWDVGGTGANLTIIHTTGTFDNAGEWEIREMSIVTVLQIDKDNHSDTWDVIAADERHYGLGVDSMTVQTLSNLICKDATMVCGTSRYAESDGDQQVCRQCSSICAEGFMYGYCRDNCPYFKIKPPITPVPAVTTVRTTLPAPLLTTSKIHESGLTSGQIGGLVGGIVGAVLLVGGIALWYYKRRRTLSYKPVNTSVESETDREQSGVLPPESGRKYTDRCTTSILSIPAGDDQTTNQGNDTRHVVLDTAQGGEQTTDTTTKAGEQTTNTTTKTGEQTTDTTTKAGEQTTDTTTKAGEQTTDTTTKAGEPTTYTTTKAGEQTADTTTKAGEQTTDTPTKAGEQTTDTTTKTGEQTTDTTTKAGEQTTDTTTKAGESTTDTTTKAGEQTTDTTTKTGEPTTYTTTKAGEQTTYTTTKAGENITDTSSKAGEQITENHEEHTKIMTNVEDNKMNVKDKTQVEISPSESLEDDEQRQENDRTTPSEEQIRLGIPEQSHHRGETGQRLQIEMVEFNSIPSFNSNEELPTPEKLTPEKNNDGSL